MGIVRGLANINKRVEETNARMGGNDPDRPKVKWVTIGDGKTLRLRFLQELDESSPGYNEKAGTGFLAVEHQAGTNYRRRALCTAEDEGACYGCEKHQENYKGGWRQKEKLYINVLVYPNNEDEEPYVAVLSQGNGSKSITPWLLEYAGDSGTITRQVFKLKRKGSGPTDTEYTLVPGPFDDEKYDVTQHELFDLDKVVYSVPYEKQKEYYLGESQPQNEVKLSSGEETSSDIEW